MMCPKALYFFWAGVNCFEYSWIPLFIREHLRRSDHLLGEEKDEGKDIGRPGLTCSLRFGIEWVVS